MSNRKEKLLITEVERQNSTIVAYYIINYGLVAKKDLITLLNNKKIVVYAESRVIRTKQMKVTIRDDGEIIAWCEERRIDTMQNLMLYQG